MLALDGDRRQRRKRFKVGKVCAGESCFRSVDGLKRTHQRAFRISERNAEHVAGDESGSFVGRGIKARVRADIVNQHALARLRDIARHADAFFQNNLYMLRAAHLPRVQFA